jgi:molybdopterin-synthase adenylyltransferase
MDSWSSVQSACSASNGNGALAFLAVGAFVRLLTPWFDSDRDFEWLELDSDNQAISRSRQPEYSIKGVCKHFTSKDLSDPFFNLSSLHGIKEEK